MTTEGNPERNSMAGFRISRSRCGANTDVNNAARIARGAAIATEINVILKLPAMSGKIPYRGCEETGCQSLPRILELLTE